MIKLFLFSCLSLVTFHQCGNKSGSNSPRLDSAKIQLTETSLQESASDTSFYPVLIELFTSQGCSSCPPADKLLSELAKRPEVVALSFHVNYWDRLGWKDPFARQAYTDRQETYGRKFQASGIYTPQMVVNGKEEFVGSDRQQAEKAISKAVALSLTATILLESQIEGNTISVNFNLAGNFMGKDFFLALVEDGIETEVKRGENSGKKLHHDNVVRQLEKLPVTHQKAGSLSLTIPEGAIKEHCHIVAWLQVTGGGEVLGIAKERS